MTIVLPGWLLWTLGVGLGALIGILAVAGFLFILARPWEWFNR